MQNFPLLQAVGGVGKPVMLKRGMNVQDATQVLRQAGFQVKVNRFGFTDKVWVYSPVGEAPPGSTITLEVGPF